MILRCYDGQEMGFEIHMEERNQEITQAGADIIAKGNLLQTAGFEKTLAAITAAMRQKN